MIESPTRVCRKYNIMLRTPIEEKGKDQTFVMKDIFIFPRLHVCNTLQYQLMHWYHLLPFLAPLGPTYLPTSAYQTSLLIHSVNEPPSSHTGAWIRDPNPGPEPESGTRMRGLNPGPGSGARIRGSNPGPECGARIRNRNQNYKRISKNIKIELEVISRFSLVVTVPNTFPIPYTKTTELWFLHGVSL